MMKRGKYENHSFYKNHFKEIEAELALVLEKFDRFPIAEIKPGIGMINIAAFDELNAKIAYLHARLVKATH